MSKHEWTISNLSDETRTVIESSGEVILTTVGGTRQVIALQACKAVNCHDELLDACKKAHRTIEHLIWIVDPADLNGNEDNDLNKIKTAIAKAEEAP